MMTDQDDRNEIDPTDAAKALGRLGGLKGGRARANSLSPERRKEIAQKAIKTRWDKHRAGADPVIPNATHGSPDHPLKIGDIEIPCYVLEDGRRVITHSGMISSLGMSKGGGSNPSAGDRLARFATGKLLEPFATKDLRAGTEPIHFRMPNGILAYGYEATVLADLCETVLSARQAGALQKQQLHIAQQCEILVRGFARVGIIALVDEATGYQYYRARKALEEILEEFISKELVKWASLFPDEFYQQVFRIRKWRYNPASTKRPIHMAKLTIDLVYERLAPGVLQELRKLTPRNEKGQLKHKLFQRLTEDVGHPRLREHLRALTVLMSAFDSWEQFYVRLDRALPRFEKTPMLNLSYEDPEESQ
jgi:hypothetical protein